MELGQMSGLNPKKVIELGKWYGILMWPSIIIYIASTKQIINSLMQYGTKARKPFFAYQVDTGRPGDENTAPHATIISWP
jgi:hypothetical protein